MNRRAEVRVPRRPLLLLPVFALSACKKADEAGKPTSAAKRLVTVGSAITETTFALGAGGDVVGVDTSSLFPEAATKLPQVGYQRTIAAEGILSLRPTMVIAGHEIGPPAALEQIKSAGIPLQIIPLGPGVAGAKARIAAVAAAVGKDAKELLAKMDNDLAVQSKRLIAVTKKPKVLALYARGAGSMQVFGKDTSAQTMIELGGGENAVSNFEGAKPLSGEGVVSAAPDVILVPSRGLESLGGIDGLLKQPGVAETPAGKARRVVAVDDVLLLGFGPRLAEAVKTMVDALHPDLPR